jgi:hypothetical protein
MRDPAWFDPASATARHNLQRMIKCRVLQITLGL